MTFIVIFDYVRFLFLCWDFNPSLRSRFGTVPILQFERYFNQMMTNNWTYVFHAALSVQSKCFHIRADSHIVDIALAITECILFVWNICGQNQAAKIYCRLYAEHFIIVLLNIIPVISRSTTSHFISIANVCY